MPESYEQFHVIQIVFFKRGYPKNHPILIMYINKPTILGGSYFEKKQLHNFPDLSHLNRLPAWSISSRRRKRSWRTSCSWQKNGRRRSWKKWQRHLRRWAAVQSSCMAIYARSWLSTFSRRLYEVVIQMVNIC